MTAYQRLLYLTAWVVVVVQFDFFSLESLQAQEEDPVDAEWYRELGEDLEVAEQRLEMLGQEVKYAEDRIQVLRQIRVLLLRLGKLEKSLEAAEEAEDEAVERGYYSVDSSDDEDRGLECRFADEMADSDAASEREGSINCVLADLE